MTQQRLAGIDAHEPPANAEDGQPDPERLEQARGPRSGSDHNLVGFDLTLIRHDPGHVVAVCHQRSRGQVVPDHCPPRCREQRQCDRQCGRIQPVAGIDEPRRRQVTGNLRLRLHERGVVELADGEAPGRDRRQRVRRLREVLLVDGDEHRADRVRIDPERERSIVRDLEVTGERPRGDRVERRVLRRNPESLVPPRGARRELVALEQGHRGTTSRELLGACRADDASADHDHVHPRSLATARLGRMIGGDVAEWPKAAAC